MEQEIIEYSVDDLSARYGVCPETIRRWTRQNLINGTKTSRKEGYIFTIADVRNFENNNPKYRSIATKRCINLHVEVCNRISKKVKLIAEITLLKHQAALLQKRIEAKQKELKKHVT